jgi:2-polyprenyl-3-methyl-5-hydroxy-6-metoxy-1,4-benzoquinol methylase
MRALEQEHADTASRKYAYDFDYRMHEYVLRRLENQLPGGRALELGCYHGAFTRLLARRYQDLTVVEGAADLIEIARREVGGGVRFVESLFESYEPDGRFDAVFLIHTLEHLDDAVALLHRIRPWLRAECGRLIVVVPNAHAASRQIAVEMGLISHAAAVTDGERAHGHRRTYSLDTLVRDCRCAGLEVRDRGGIFFKPLANFQLDLALKLGVVNEAYMEGCYQLGLRYPDLCSSIFAVCEPARAVVAGPRAA